MKMFELNSTKDKKDKEVSAPIVPGPIGGVEPAGAEERNEGVLAGGEAVGMGGAIEGERRGIKRRRRSDSEGEGSALDREGEGSASAAGSEKWRDGVTEGNWTEGLVEWVVNLIRKVEPEAPWVVLRGRNGMGKKVWVLDRIAEKLVERYGVEIERDGNGERKEDARPYRGLLDRFINQVDNEEIAELKREAIEEAEKVEVEEFVPVVSGTWIHTELADYVARREWYMNREFEIGKYVMPIDRSPLPAEASLYLQSQKIPVSPCFTDTEESGSDGEWGMAPSVWEGEVVESMVRTIEMIIGW